MSVFYMILIKIMLPIFLLVGVGAVLHRKFNLDLNTLSKLVMYLLLPVVSFVNLYEGDVSFKLMMYIAFFLLCHSSGLVLLSSLIVKIMKQDRSSSASFKNSVVLSNAGNFGIPVNELVFHKEPIGAAIGVMVSIFQSIMTYTYGMFNSVSAKSKRMQTFAALIRQPIILSLLLAIFLRWSHIKVPFFIWDPLETVSNAFLAIALITLGAQVSNLKITKISKKLGMAVSSKLILSPVIAFIIITLFNITGVPAQALFIASSYPTSRNSALLALEYHNDPEFAAQAVLLSTISSSFTVSVVVLLSKYIG